MSNTTTPESTSDSISTYRPSVYAILLIGVLAVSTASLFIRFAQADGTPSLVIAAMRLSLAALILTPWTFYRHRPALRTLSRRDLVLAITSGALLAVHFAAWITSLEHTSVLISVVLVTTNPLWVALFSPLLLGEPLNRRTLIGILIAIGGGLLISLNGDRRALLDGANPLLGALLALIGAVAAALYLIIGRRLRASLALVPYVWLCYGTAALFLLLAVLISGNTITGYRPTVYLWLLLLAIFPQLIGHSSFNYALAHLPVAFVSLVILGEPVGSAILAVIFLQEMPGAIQIIGAALILFAVVFASQAQRPSAAK